MPRPLLLTLFLFSFIWTLLVGIAAILYPDTWGRFAGALSLAFACDIAVYIVDRFAPRRS